jgi:uncharacterized protein with HEPN domain
MKQPDDPARAGHILDAAEKVLSWIGGKSRAEFDADEVLRSAVAYQLQIIGEAASHLSDEFRLAHPEIPWRDVIGMRNIIVHAYRRVTSSILWSVATGQLGTLIDVVRPIAPPLEDE